MRLERERERENEGGRRGGGIERLRDLNVWHMLLGRNHSCARTRFVMCEARRASACPHVRAQCLASDSLQHKNVASEPAIRKQAFMRPMQGVEVLNKVLKSYMQKEVR